MKEIDPQSSRVHFLELLININRLRILATEDEALSKPIIEELMNNPLFKTLCKSAFEEAMENPAIKTFQNCINKE